MTIDIQEWGNLGFPIHQIFPPLDSTRKHVNRGQLHPYEGVKATTNGFYFLRELVLNELFSEYRVHDVGILKSLEEILKLTWIKINPSMASSVSSMYDSYADPFSDINLGKLERVQEYLSESSEIDLFLRQLHTWAEIRAARQLGLYLNYKGKRALATPSTFVEDTMGIDYSEGNRTKPFKFDLLFMVGNACFYVDVKFSASIANEDDHVLSGASYMISPESRIVKIEPSNKCISGSNGLSSCFQSFKPPFLLIKRNQTKGKCQEYYVNVPISPHASLRGCEMLMGTGENVYDYLCRATAESILYDLLAARYISFGSYVPVSVMKEIMPEDALVSNFRGMITSMLESSGSSTNKNFRALNHEVMIYYK